MRLLLAAGLCAIAAWALTNPQTGGRGCVQMERYLGAWSGTQTCRSGKYAVGFDLQGDAARYSVSSQQSESAQPVSGEVRFAAGAKPGTCDALAQTPFGEIRFLVSFAEAGRKLSYRASGMKAMGMDIPPLGKVFGSAAIDAAFKRAGYRFYSELPMAVDTCQGSLRRSAAKP